MIKTTAQLQQGGLWQTRQILTLQTIRVIRFTVNLAVLARGRGQLNMRLGYTPSGWDLWLFKRLTMVC